MLKIDCTAFGFGMELWNVVCGCGLLFGGFMCCIGVFSGFCLRGVSAVRQRVVLLCFIVLDVL